MSGEFFTYTLPNGVRCILKRTSSPVVHCAMTINTGTRDELRGEFGIAHMVEHNIFKGTTHRRAHHINCRLENLGGELNAYTAKEETVIYATSLKRDFAKAVELLVDVIFHSTFPEHEVEMEKEVIFDEINLYKDTPAERIFDDWEDLLFEGSELGHNILGSKATLRRLHSSHLTEFVRRTYNTDQMVFSVTGNIGEAQFVRTIDRYLAAEPANLRGFVRSAPAPIEQFHTTRQRGTHQAHCIIGGRGYDLHSERRLPLVMLTNIVGGPSANSLLNVLLREKNALSYAVEAAYTPMSDCGNFTIYFSSDKERTERCHELVMRQLTDLCEKPLSPRRLQTAKRQFLGQFTVSGENAEGYMLGVGKSYLSFGTVDSQQDIFDRVNSLSAMELVDVATDTFKNLSTLIYR